MSGSITVVAIRIIISSVLFVIRSSPPIKKAAGRGLRVVPGNPVAAVISICLNKPARIITSPGAATKLVLIASSVLPVVASSLARLISKEWSLRANYKVTLYALPYVCRTDHLITANRDLWMWTVRLRSLVGWFPVLPNGSETWEHHPDKDFFHDSGLAITGGVAVFPARKINCMTHALMGQSDVPQRDVLWFKCCYPALPCWANCVRLIKQILQEHCR